MILTLNLIQGGLKMLTLTDRKNLMEAGRGTRVAPLRLARIFKSLEVDNDATMVTWSPFVWFIQCLYTEGISKTLRCEHKV